MAVQLRAGVWAMSLKRREAFSGACVLSLGKEIAPGCSTLAAERTAKSWGGRATANGSKGVPLCCVQLQLKNMILECLWGHYSLYI